ncbi:hypothetical protein [Floccifex sp.]|uniref:hypothetical protein n=1 Tax=Floccifex sp. TaxID=2815810 RepID=UPI003F03CF60
MISRPKKYLERGAKKFSSLKEILMILNTNTVLKDAFSNLEEEELIDVEVD